MSFLKFQKLGLNLRVKTTNVRVMITQPNVLNGSKANLSTSTLNPFGSDFKNHELKTIQDGSKFMAHSSLLGLNSSSILGHNRVTFKSKTYPQLIRFMTTSTLNATIDNSTKEGKSQAETNAPIVGYWMLGMGVLVFGIVVIGGLTRLTESGLSIVEWNLIKGIKPPTNDLEWQQEFEKYQQFPEFKKLNNLMTLEEFKFIFFMEWLHRLWGRAIGMAFIVPGLYFYARKKMTPAMAKRSLGLAGLIGFQGALGWYMVKSGLSEQLMEDPSAVPRVSQYRLASHLGAAFALFAGFMLTGFEILSDNKQKVKPLKNFFEKIQDPKLRSFRKFATGTTLLVFATAMSGAFVAGLDAGMIYNSFPYMGDSIIPPSDEMWSPLYSDLRGQEILPNGQNPSGMWRNIFDNPTTVQFAHRVMATATLTSIVALYLASRKVNLSRASRLGVHAMLGVSFIQVTLGISTLIYLVPVPLAAAHQSGSLALLTSGLYLVHSLRRFPKRL